MPSRDVAPFRVFDLWFVVTMALAPAGISVFSVLLDSSSAVLANAVLSLLVTDALLAVAVGLWWFDYRDAQWVAREKGPTAYRDD